VTKRPQTHPAPGALLELHFGEAGPAGAAAARHLSVCEVCRHRRDELVWIEALLAADAEPPADGLARVLAAVAATPPAVPRRRHWVRAVLPSAAAATAGVGSIRLLGAHVAASGLVNDAALGPLAALSGLGLAAAVFFAVGSLVTLTVAPLLILEANAARALGTAGR
jgi:hypothetical protein